MILELGGGWVRGGEEYVRMQIFDHTHQYVNKPTYHA